MIVPVDYILKFHGDFYPVITSGFKCSTIRDKSKPLKIDDYVYAYFKDIDEVIVIKIIDHYAKRLDELSNVEAKNEGYYHVNLLKHTLKNIYPNLKDDDYVYYYEFQNVKHHHALDNWITSFKNAHNGGEKL